MAWNYSRFMWNLQNETHENSPSCTCLSLKTFHMAFDFFPYFLLIWQYHSCDRLALPLADLKLRVLSFTKRFCSDFWGRKQYSYKTWALFATNQLERQRQNKKMLVKLNYTINLVSYFEQAINRKGQETEKGVKSSYQFQKTQKL